MTEQAQNNIKKSEAKNPKTVHILITQCLQNGFFLSDSNRLSLPPEVVERVLLGNQKAISTSPSLRNKEPNQRYFNQANLKQGPLYRFLETAIDKKDRNSELHVIHVKDWHTLSPRYDEERQLYGGHCEANTWEAEPLAGYEKYLNPWTNEKREQLTAARSLDGYKTEENPKVTFYEVLSDSVFDFKRSKTIDCIPSLENALDKAPESASHLSLLMDKLIDDVDHIYLVVIGVYTDIKIKTLTMGFRSRYDIDNLIVSDVLTVSPTLERHLSGLDFMDKVLNIEIVSDLNTIISILDIETRTDGKSSEENPIPKTLTEDSIKWRNYRHHFLDKQTVLSYQDQLLAEYMKLTTGRSKEIYNQSYKLNVWLTNVGKIAIGLLLILIIANMTPWLEISTETFVVTGIASFAQIIPMFITGPQERMQKSLTTLVRLRNYLETYSMISALMRHHLTRAERLEESSIGDLQEQIELISKAAESLHENFRDLSYRPDDNAQPSDTVG